MAPSSIRALGSAAVTVVFGALMSAITKQVASLYRGDVRQYPTRVENKNRNGIQKVRLHGGKNRSQIARLATSKLLVRHASAPSLLVE